MSLGKEQIKVQVTQRTDGRVTVTLKLIGFLPSRINGLIYQMQECNIGLISRMSKAMHQKLIDTFTNYDRVPTELGDE